MEDLKDMMKSLTKPFKGSGSGAFKGQGHRLGGGEPSAGPSKPASGSLRNPPPQRSGVLSQPGGRGIPPSPSSSRPAPPPTSRGTAESVTSKPREAPVETLRSGTEDAGPSAAPSHGASVQQSASTRMGQLPRREGREVELDPERYGDLHSALAVSLSAAPPQASLEVLLRILSNILAEPGNPKFRRLRLGNQRISEALGSIVGGMDVLQAIGFTVVEEKPAGVDGPAESWAVLDDQSEDQLARVNQAVTIVGAHCAQQLSTPSEPEPAPPQQLCFSLSRSGKAPPAEEPPAPAPVAAPVVQPMDRQVRVFLPASVGQEGQAGRIELPDSFFVRTAAEVRAEAVARQRQMEESQVLMTRAMKEKQAAALKRKYKACIIRIQFPDNVVLQGVFAPNEPISALYEFVAKSLKLQGQDFKLVYSFPSKNPFPSPFPAAGKATVPTLEEAELVPASLVKFKVNNGAFIGIRDDLLLSAVPLTSVPFPEPVK